MAEAPGFGGLAGLTEELRQDADAKDPVMQMAIEQGLRELYSQKTVASGPPGAKVRPS